MSIWSRASVNVTCVLDKIDDAVEIFGKELNYDDPDWESINCDDDKKYLPYGSEGSLKYRHIMMTDEHIDFSKHVYDIQITGNLRNYSNPDLFRVWLENACSDPRVRYAFMRYGMDSEEDRIFEYDESVSK